VTTRDVLVGIDKGTSSIKAVAVDAVTGELVAQSGSRTPSNHPRHGWHEEDMEGTWQACASAIRQVVGGLDAGTTVLGVGVTGHMGGLWPLDAAGLPIGPAICWPDARAVTELRRVNESARDRLFDIGGNAIIPGQPYPLLAWLKANDPATYERVATVLIAKDWINYRLTGLLGTEESDLSFWPADIRARTVSSEMFELFNIPEAQSFVPDVRRSDALLGKVTAEAARTTGLPAGTPVVAGCGDATANMLGVGAQQDGDATTTIGTSLMNGVLTSTPVLDPPGVGFSFLQPEDKWQRQITNSGGGTMCLDWVVERFFSREAQRIERGEIGLGALVGAAVAATPAGNDGLVFHPYLNTAGATAPFVDVNARGSLVHFNPGTTPAHLVRAVLEGTALAIRDCYEAMPVPVREIRLTGGGARSAAWSQIIADTLQKEILVPDVPESGALGVAMLAGVAVKRYASLGEAARVLVADGRTHQPDARAAPVYDAAFAEYRRLLKPLRQVWSRSAAHVAGALQESDA